MENPSQQNSRPKRECHKCRRNGTGDDYCWKHCLGPADDSNKGISKVSLGSLESESEYIFANADSLALPKEAFSGRSPDGIQDAEDDADDFFGHAAERSAAQAPRGVTEQLDDEVEHALVVILANLMSLSDTQLCIFRHIFHGEDLKDTGARLPVPITKQAVFKHLLKMVRENKVVAKVIHGMMRKGQGGAKKQMSQLELFDFCGV